MSRQVDGFAADSVIRLNFAARAVPQSPPAMAPFMVEARADGWKLHAGNRTLDAAELMEAADLLRDIARSLADMAYAAAGQPPQPCIAEFVLYETGGIDHWIANGADCTRLRLGLRTALSTVREP
ncbi:hypothetical protein [Magnetospirillum sulfuroxidans]|uniref:Uncharacterized protein n=1 Tax=Magnetospirillum sulfuroxidans TaxID=611300 RepID=A0ABS5IHT0_9PROT|nr:hypothetical protein [Magnetospirillum sulfuroxidans]MBR9973767.1 hypothetical protein [Magnetospirillum sulfuroxidans]